MAAVAEQVRQCLCGCGESLEGRAPQTLYVNDTHTKRYKRRSNNTVIVYPVQITNDVRECRCEAHELLYLEINGPYGWTGYCRQCVREHALQPVVKKLLEDRREELTARVHAEMERSKPELDKLIEEQLQEQIPFLYEQIYTFETDKKRIEILQVCEQSFADEILQELMTKGTNGNGTTH
jgi:hypothetical protein